MLVREEEVCRRAAIAYRDWHLHSDETFSQLRRVLVAVVGDVYMVDDEREPTGRSAVWAVLMFDHSIKSSGSVLAILGPVTDVGIGGRRDRSARADPSGRSAGVARKSRREGAHI